MKHGPQPPPKIIIEAVYRSKDGTWRGFCVPFDISCTAETAEKAMKAIDELVELYIDGLKKYGFPVHLTVKELSDEEDRKVFGRVLKHVIADMTKKMRSDLEKFQLERKAIPFTMTDNSRVRGNYSFLPTNTPVLT